MILSTGDAGNWIGTFWLQSLSWEYKPFLGNKPQWTRLDLFMTRSDWLWPDGFRRSDLLVAGTRPPQEGVSQNVLMPCPQNTPTPEVAVLTAGGCYNGRDHSWSAPLAVQMAGGKDQEHFGGKTGFKRGLSHTNFPLLWVTSQLCLYGQASGLRLPWGYSKWAAWPDPLCAKQFL